MEPLQEELQMARMREQQITVEMNSVRKERDDAKAEIEKLKALLASQHPK